MSSISPANIKQRLVGLGPWLDAAAALAAPYSYNDATITNVINASLRRFEQEAQFAITPVQIWTTPDGTNPVDATAVNTINEDPYDYSVADSHEYFRITLRHRPVRTVQRVRVMFGTMTVYTIPSEWYQVKNRVGIFHVVTQFGSLAVASAMAGYALMGMGLSDKNYMPNALAVDYVAGLDDNWYDEWEWSGLRRCIEEYAALAVLNDISQLADAGLVSVTTSGANASESRQYDRFQGRKQELQASIDKYMATLVETESMFPMTWV